MQTLRNIKFVLSIYAKHHKWALIFIFVATFLMSLDSIISAYLFKIVIDNLTVGIATHTFDTTGIILPIVYSGIVDLIYFLFNYLDTYWTNVLMNTFSNVVRINLVEKIVLLDQATLESPEFNDKLEKITSKSFDSFLSYFLETTSVFGYLVEVISGVIAMLSLPILLILALILVIPNYFLQRSSSKFRLKLFELRKPAQRKRNYLFTILTDNKMSPEIKITNAYQYLVVKYKQILDIFEADNTDIEKKRLRVNLPLGLNYVVSQVGVRVYLLLEVIGGVISLGDFTFLTSRFFNFRDRIGYISQSIERLHDSNDYVKDYYDLMALPTLPAEDNKHKITTEDITITFDNVSFKYPGATHYSLKNLSFTIRNGEKVAFVGQNGAGKTTLIKLICRFYAPTKGRILINGIDLQDINLASWYNKLGALFQDYNRYNLTVKENIGIGRVEQIQSLKAIKAASSRSGAEEIISKLDSKYDQMLGKSYEKGTDLSGGQWQKIALARAYMRDPEILMLDEPTAAIDAKAEAEIFAKLHDLGQGKTLILISHRFSTVRQVDKIYVIEQGTIKEHGSHRELMELDGRYAEMYNLQAKMYN